MLSWLAGWRAAGDRADFSARTAKKNLDSDSGLESDLESQRSHECRSTPEKKITTSRYFRTSSNNNNNNNNDDDDDVDVDVTQKCQDCEGDDRRLDAAGSRLAISSKEGASNATRGYDLNAPKALMLKNSHKSPDKYLVTLKRPERNVYFSQSLQKNDPATTKSKVKISSVVQTSSCSKPDRGFEILGSRTSCSTASTPPSYSEYSRICSTTSSKSRCDSNDSVFSGQSTLRGRPTPTSNLSSGIKMCSSQTTLADASSTENSLKFPISKRLRGERSLERKSNFSPQRTGRDNSKFATTTCLSEENLSKTYASLDSVGKVQGGTARTPSRIPARSQKLMCISPESGNSLAKHKGKSQVQLNPFTFHDLTSRESLATPTSSVVGTNDKTDTASGGDKSRLKKSSRIRSLDSTPETRVDFKITSLPTPAKSRKSSLSALKEFFSLKPRRKCSATEIEARARMRCRRRLFSVDDVLHEESSLEESPRFYERKLTETQKRFLKNEKNGQAWLAGSPGSTLSKLLINSTTPELNLNVSTLSESDAAQVGMRKMLSVFIMSSRGRIGRRLTRLESVGVDRNSAAIISRISFQRDRDGFMRICQSLFLSFKDFSLNLLSLRGGWVGVQAVYYKNSEQFVNYLSEFLESSEDFINVIFAARIKRHFKGMSQDVANEGLYFLDCSYVCIVGSHQGADGSYRNLNERFNEFSRTFGKLIGWMRKLEYGDTVSVLL